MNEGKAGERKESQIRLKEINRKLSQHNNMPRSGHHQNLKL